MSEERRASTVNVMQPTFYDLPQSRAIGVRGVVSSSFSPDAADSTVEIEKLWIALFTALGTTPGSPEWTFVGITSPADDLVPPHFITYAAAVLVDDAFSKETGLEEFSIGAGTYAVFLYEGTHEGLDAFYQQVYNVELDQHGLSTRDGEHLERYPTSNDSALFVAEAWIPVSTPSGS
ncbi:MAG: GyrI-like domain-containing protein [Actinomycetota bacterium]